MVIDLAGLKEEVNDCHDLRVEESEVERFAQGLRVAPTSTPAATPATPKKHRTPAPIIDLELFEPDGRIKRRRRA